MKHGHTIIIAATVLICSGCSDHDSGKVETQDHVWKDQVKALDKANEVDQLLQDSAAKQRADIDRQSE